ncbi:MAG: hypothetical protein GX989_08455 [Firmicutes bacterium]|nr:hypothetical protein [Bacillota bacterium]
MYVDKKLNCKDCGREFNFPASEQKSRAEKGLTGDHSRCPECRSAREARNKLSQGDHSFL